MFKKFKDSPYAKAALLVLVCGSLLIIFNSWISKNQISIGFENINRTLAPIYIGGIFAFILCPVYNACVKWCYARMLAEAKRKGFSIGAMIVRNDGDLVICLQTEQGDRNAELIIEISARLMYLVLLR